MVLKEKKNYVANGATTQRCVWGESRSQRALAAGQGSYKKNIHSCYYSDNGYSRVSLVRSLWNGMETRIARRKEIITEGGTRIEAKNDIRIMTPRLRSVRVTVNESGPHANTRFLMMNVSERVNRMT
ncbi:hypothetical protein EVAR_29409_1 [Eumeta japonica]|uniref:Uncharacterized protein n=1 Tax=Eumeta variegata TaxID=151549 RepID=A0A4C1VVY1_EUMVA|nr:hypothetical protein EVAR_29409_1 [Eumeta japonica]